MKTQREALILRVQDYVVQLRSHRDLKVGGMPVSRTNLDILSRGLRSWLFLIEDLMLRLHLSDASRLARMDNFISCILVSDILDVQIFLDSVYMNLVTDSYSDIPAFKQHCISLTLSSQLVHERLLSPIAPAIYSFLSETDNKKKADLLSSICQFARFLRKLEFQDIGLEAQAIKSYVQTEQELEAFHYEDEETLQGVSLILRRWLRDFHIEDLLPSNGPGSVAEGPLTQAEKFSVMKTDKILQILLRNHTRPDSYREYFPLSAEDGLERISRTIFVPKTVVKLRTISMEPATLQYIQQGVMLALYRFIENHPYLGVRIKLQDQEQNQYLALEGSKYRNYGTIDLSNASDSVSWDLIKRVFSSSPRLYRWLLGTRSHSTILPNGEVLRLNKFAPMGSALCFPIQCLLFAAITEYAIRKVTKLRKEQPALFSVYGDDIVVPSTCYDAVIDSLKLCGFKVNVTKSYCNKNYTESCGKEYYGGYDISPLYYRIPFYNRRVSPAAYGSLCSCANNAYLHRLPVYREYILDWIFSCGHSKQPYFIGTPEMSPYLYSPTPTNFKTKLYWNKHYQRYEGRFLVVKSKQRNSEGDDDNINYHIALVNMAKRSTSASISHIDELSSPRAASGCVVLFSTSRLPAEGRFARNKRNATDWIDDVC